MMVMMMMMMMIEIEIGCRKNAAEILIGLIEV